MARSGLFWRIFLGIFTVSLGSVVTVGLVARTAFTSAFGTYIEMGPGMHGRGMMGPGRTALLGAAEQAFLASVDRGVLLGGVVAATVAAIAALLIARTLAAPLRDLEEGAALLAAGNLGHRVEIDGPSEMAALGESFNSMAGALEEAEDLRRRMVADVAHELRNPLTAARAQAEGMAEGVLPLEESRVESVVEDLTHLSRLVDDLQELALAEAGRLSYEMRPVDLVTLARHEAQRTAPHAGPDVDVRFEAGVERAVAQGDEMRLAQVVRNLLSNALRHTSAGSVTVSVVSAPDDTSEVRVTDTGSGIDAADLPHVFERFYRADAARAAHTGGAGLGLAIARRIVEDHGGTVFAESAPDGGASVGFRLPLAHPKADRSGS